jgi:hypothetical protein
MALRTRSYDQTFYDWVARAGSRHSATPITAGWHTGNDAIATTVAPKRTYEELFPDDD